MPFVLLLLLAGTAGTAWATNRKVPQSQYLWIVRGKRPGVSREAIAQGLTASGYRVYSLITNPADGSWAAEVSSTTATPPGGELATMFGITETRAA